MYIEALNESIKLAGCHVDVLNNMNANRLAELYVHTVSKFCDAHLVSEHELEMIHREFEKWLETSTHNNSHISAVEVALRWDCGASLYGTWRSTTCIADRFTKNSSRAERRVCFNRYHK